MTSGRRHSVSGYHQRIRWIVGDVQGCAAELEDLLEVIQFTPGRDELWIAGDVINRGPASDDALRVWRSVDGKAVLGNHDLYALAAWRGLRPRKASDTLDSLFTADDRDLLLARLATSPSLVYLASAGDGPDAWLVHAGLAPQWTDPERLMPQLNARPGNFSWLDDQDIWFAATVRCCDPQGTPLKSTGIECAPGFRPWFDFYTGSTLVVHGHWATRGHYRGTRSLGLDSGCVYGGPLTAWCQDEDRIVQVRSRQPQR